MSMMSSLLSPLRRGINGVGRALVKLVPKSEMEQRKEMMKTVESCREDMDGLKKLDFHGKFEWKELDREQKLKIHSKVNGMREVMDEIDKTILLEESDARIEWEKALDIKRDIDGAFVKVRGFLHDMEQWRRRSVEQSTHMPPEESSSRVTPSDLMEFEYKYPILKCMEEYRSIGGFTSHEDMKVYHLFSNKDNCKIFLSLEDGKRVEWLRNMLSTSEAIE